MKKVAAIFLGIWFTMILVFVMDDVYQTRQCEAGPTETYFEEMPEYPEEEYI